jgi:6-pyruvoyltetrahydropterin/6-carboxytetrahydropterin synthase
MTVFLKRRRMFSAAHRYGRPDRDSEWNRRHYGDLSEIHGHNYLAEVTISGDVDEATGIVVNLADVKVWLAAAVSPFENRCISVESPEMNGRQPSTENLARVVWERLEPAFASTPASLCEVKVAESDELWSEYRGEENVVYVTRMYDFSAAHRLHSDRLSDDENRSVFGKCNHPGGHGHNYVLEVTVRAAVDEETGFSYPLDRLDEAVDRHVLDPMDHRNLNADVPQLQGVNPTTENVAIVIWEALRPEIGEALYRVRVQETPRNTFEYYGG